MATSTIRKTNIQGATSAFGDLISSELSPISQYAFEYNMVDNTEFWSLTETNGGTVTTNNAKALVRSNTTTGAVAQMKSARPVRYRAGLGTKFRFTAVFSAPAASCHQIIGIFDETGSTTPYKNGYGIGYDGTTLKLFHFLNDTDQSLALSAATDPLDGTGASGITIDPTKLNIFEIDFAYLGTGDIIYRIYSTSQQKFVEIHRVQRANLFAVPHSYNPNYNIYLYAANNGTTSDVSVSTASMAHFVQGFTRYREIHQPTFGYETSATGVTTKTQLFSIRNKSTYTSVINLIDILPLYFSCSYEASVAGRGVIKIVKNPTLGGTASWTDISTTNSVVEVDTAQTTVTDEGKLLAVFYVGGQFDSRGPLEIEKEGLFISPGDEVAVLVESTQSADVDAFISWKELF